MMTTTDFECLSRVPFNLTALMRQYKVTIQQLSVKAGITQKQIRQIRKQTRVSYMTFCDYHEAVTGECVFNRARYDAMSRQFQTL
jgi:DNA-binding transcriptional regulator YiaG